jgi:DNA-binding NtrC family response regulator
MVNLKKTPRILVLDDDILIGHLLQDYLTDLNCETVGPVTTVADALELLQRAEITGAILDVTLNENETSYQLADILSKRGTPFAFSTGHTSDSIAQRFSGIKSLSKPFVLEDVRVLIEGWK